MSERGVFISKDTYPFFEEVYVEFDWFGGFALSQKRKCQLSLHLNFNKKYDNKILEISSSSLVDLGTRLSAMNLSKQTSKGVTSVESAFQSSRVYYCGTGKIGPFPELLFIDGKTCKKIVKGYSMGLHSYEYEYEGLKFNAPDYHISLFYDYLYLNALLEEENRDVANKLIEEGYTAFSDLATKALNSQARSCAIFVSLHKLGLLDQVKDYKSYLELFRVDSETLRRKENSYENVQLLKKKDTVELLSPLVEKQVLKSEVERYYTKYYSHLTNQKYDEYTRLGLYDVEVSTKDVYKLQAVGELVGIRFMGDNACIDVPLDYLEGYELSALPIKELECHDEMYMSREEYRNKVLYPSVGKYNEDILGVLLKDLESVIEEYREQRRLLESVKENYF